MTTSSTIFREINALFNIRDQLRARNRRPVEELTSLEDFFTYVDESFFFVLWNEFIIPFTKTEAWDDAVPIAELLENVRRMVAHAGKEDHRVPEQVVWDNVRAEWDKMEYAHWKNTMALFFVKRIQTAEMGNRDATLFITLIDAIEQTLPPKYSNDFNLRALKNLRKSYEGKQEVASRHGKIIPFDLEGFCRDPEVITILTTPKLTKEYPETVLRGRILGDGLAAFLVLTQRIYREKNHVPLPLTPQELSRLVEIIVGKQESASGTLPEIAPKAEPLEILRDGVIMRRQRLQRMMMVKKRLWPTYPEVEVAELLEKSERESLRLLPKLFAIKRQEIIDTLNRKGNRNKLALALVFDSVEAANLMPRNNSAVKDWHVKRSIFLKTMESVFSLKEIGYQIYYQLNERLLQLNAIHMGARSIENGERSYKADPMVSDIRILLLIILEDAVRGTIQLTGTQKSIRFEMFMEQTFRAIAGELLVWREMVDPDELRAVLLSPLDHHRQRFSLQNFLLGPIWLAFPTELVDWLKARALDGPVKDALEMALHANYPLRKRLEDYWQARNEANEEVMAKKKSSWGLADVVEEAEEMGGAEKAEIDAGQLTSAIDEGHKKAVVEMLQILRASFRNRDIFTGNVTGKEWFHIIFQGAVRRLTDLASKKSPELSRIRPLNDNELLVISAKMEQAIFALICTVEERIET